MKKFLCVLLLMAFVLTGCGSAPEEAKPVEPAPPAEVDTSAQQEVKEQADESGISGMASYPIRSVLSGDPFNIPMEDLTPADGASGCAYTCSATGGGEGRGVMYDYSLTLDGDEEIIGASFGIVSTTANEEKLLTEADMYFYAVSLIEYDNSDKETLAKWFEDNLGTAGSEATETTIGDAKFQLYGVPGATYWVDISKA